MLEDCSPPLHSSARRWCFSQRHRFKPKRRCQNKCTEQAKPSIRHHFASRCLAQLFGCSLNFLIQASSALRNIAQDRCQEQATSIHCAIRAGHSGPLKCLNREHLCCGEPAFVRTVRICAVKIRRGGHRTPSDNIRHAWFDAAARGLARGRARGRPKASSARAAAAATRCKKELREASTAPIAAKHQSKRY